MGTATVEKVTKAQAAARRAAILTELNMSLGEVRQRAEDYLLSPDQTAQWRRVEELTWLLGE